MYPEAFESIDGRLFFSPAPDIHSFWLRDRQAFIRQADSNWPFLMDSDRFGPGIRRR